ncbi:hypothetical protein Pla52n_19590 [Stieleria varia]|uniref:Uncharacterized protein n=1 Tax=Stieleria varia TaxID=2528005 RepID=A0A5C6B2S4_9BACT|nr:hypothetical protein Pla52n_19590 [Stieleria varia]
MPNHISRLSGVQIFTETGPPKSTSVSSQSMPSRTVIELKQAARPMVPVGIPKLTTVRPCKWESAKLDAVAEEVSLRTGSMA